MRRAKPPDPIPRELIECEACRHCDTALPIKDNVLAIHVLMLHPTTKEAAVYLRRKPLRVPRWGFM